MGRPRKVRPDWNAMATIWTVSDELWGVIAPILADLDPPKATGRPRVDARRTLDAIIFRLRSGCQAAANGTNCPSVSLTIAQCIAPSSAGCASASSRGSGPPW